MIRIVVWMNLHPSGDPTMSDLAKITPCLWFNLYGGFEVIVGA